MAEVSEFEDIRPYSDEEAVDALARVSSHPLLPVISKYLFPNESAAYLNHELKKVQSISDFQKEIMSGVISSIIAKTSEGFTWSGQENLRENGGNFVAMTNHRDIVLDPALFLYVLHDMNQLGCELCVGSNLLQSQLMEDLMRSNRMIKVIRGVNVRELYFTARKLSRYIREKITTGNGSVWIAQREGRTKDGLDRTEQGVLKMLELSGEKSFEENFRELNIIPISISYEYEPCDARKAREILIRQQTGTYVKKPREDTHSILTGIRQRKGHIHLNIGKPLTEEEIHEAAMLSGNERYHFLMDVLDRRINDGYKLWKTNYIAHDMVEGKSEYLGVKYLPEDYDNFKAYMNHKLSKIESSLDRVELEKIFLRIYSNSLH